MTCADAGCGGASTGKRAASTGLCGGLPGAGVAGALVGDEGEVFELGDQLAQGWWLSTPVLDLVVGDQAAGDGLAGCLAGPLPVGAMQDGRVGVAAAAGPTAADVRWMRVPGRARPRPRRRCRRRGPCWLGVGDTLSSSHAGCVIRPRSFSTNYFMDTGGVAGYIAGWKPAPGVPVAAAEFARQVVAAAAPGGRDRAKSLLWAAGKLACWAIPLGMEPAPECCCTRR